MGQLRFTILGCGSSGGVPRIGNHWGECDPHNPKNRRTRCSLLVERMGELGTTRLLIDTSPDMREQLLRAGVGSLDAVAYTHSHADHVHGIDDLRQIMIATQSRLPVWADPATEEALKSRFDYIFVQPEGSPYPPICDMNTITGPFVVSGPGGTIALAPFRVQHGDTEALGFRIASVAYLPDVSDIPPETWQHLQNLDCWILDTLRRRPHPTHVHLERALEWIARARPTMAILTNMHNDLDYAVLEAETPDAVHAGHDGMTIDIAG